jgi:outer membrane protein insertion porin family
VPTTSRPPAGSRRSRVILLCLALLLAAGPVLAQESAPAASAEVRQVVIEGNRRVETETIRARLQTREGAVFDPETVSADIRAIHALGFFEDVTADASGFEGGLAITFRLKEKPLIIGTDFRGNKDVSSEDLRKALDISTQMPLNEVNIKSNVERLLAVLHQKGYYRARVDWRLEPLGENEMNLVFVIAEGEIVKVTSIEIQGNEILSDEEIVDQMETTEKGFFTWLTGSGILESQKLDDDVLRIRSHLYNQGFLKSRVDRPVVTVDPEGNAIRIVIGLSEGPRYTVAAVEVAGDEIRSAEEIRAVMKVRTGSIFNRDLFGADISAITSLYSDLGYAFCRVDPDFLLDDAAATVRLRLSVNPGPKVKVGRITIVGNNATRDNVIRREVVLREGEFFSGRQLSRSRQKINNLGFFDRVDVSTSRRGEDVIDVQIEVTERLTGALTFGFGYSSETKLGGVIKLTEENFFGWGHKVQFSIDYAEKLREYNLYYFNPAIMDSGWSGGARAYDISGDMDQYRRDTLGWSLTVGHTIGEYIKGYLSFKNERVEVSEVDPEASELIRSQEGIFQVRTLSLTFTRDTRDDYFNPTRGTNSRLKVDYQGDFMGGDTSFVRTVVEAAWYHPLFWELVFMLHGEYGQMESLDDQEIPIYERFFLGGINSVRGFGFRGVGPKDENGDPIGGTKELLLNAEVIFPLNREQRVSLVLFFDAGNAFLDGENVSLDSLRTSAGAGLRWFSPIGPFRIEWGFNLDPQPGEKDSDWEFSIGTAF